MFYLTYEAVTKKGKYTTTRYYPYKTREISSEILPKILKAIFKKHPDEKLVYVKLIDIVKE